MFDGCGGCDRCDRSWLLDIVEVGCELQFMIRIEIAWAGRHSFWDTNSGHGAWKQSNYRHPITWLGKKQKNKHEISSGNSNHHPPITSTSNTFAASTSTWLQAAKDIASGAREVILCASLHRNPTVRQLCWHPNKRKASLLEQHWLSLFQNIIKSLYNYISIRSY